jgi:hypothetical protein
MGKDLRLASLLWIIPLIIIPTLAYLSGIATNFFDKLERKMNKKLFGREFY